MHAARRLLFLSATLLAACHGATHAAEPLPAPRQDLPPPAGPPGPAAKEAAPRTLVLAAGCFWCVEAAFERVEGVLDVVSGYAGGTEDDADYEKVSAGATGHAESVRVTWDPARISYGQLLRVFFSIHDPTTKDRQGPDWGRQYRSAIFYASEDERRVAAAYIRQLDESKRFGAPVVTTLEPLRGFYRAEAYHQDFIRYNPDHPYVRMWFPAKLEKLRTLVPERLKAAAR